MNYYLQSRALFLARHRQSLCRALNTHCQHATESWAQNYKFGGKELDEMHGLNMYDQGARFFGTWIPVTMQMDPLAELRPHESPYSAFGNNPIRNVDPTGLMWYTTNDGTYQFNPDLTEDNQSEILKKGETFIGATHKDGTGMYRADGSIMFSIEKDAYSRMWNSSQLTKKEEMGVITDKGVLVLPSYKNDEGTATPENYGYSWKDGNIKDADGNTFNTLGTLHTHPNPKGDKTASWEDVAYFSAKVPNKPYFVVMADQKISSYMSYPPNKGSVGYGSITMPSINGASFSLPNLTSGRYPLIPTLTQNRRR